MSPSLPRSVLDVLSTLLDQRGQPVTIDALARASRLGPDQVRESLSILGDHACEIAPIGVDTVQLFSSGGPCWAPYLRSRREGNGAVDVRQSVSSTQDVARSHLERNGARAEGTVVLADQQTRGRGRRGRRWVAPPGTGVLLSRIFLFDRTPNERAVNHLIASSAVAVAGALEAAAGSASELPTLQIRWPNDLVVNQQKLAGILVECFTAPDHEVTAAVVGVGVNVANPTADLQGDRATPSQDRTSLRDLGVDVDRLKVVERIVTALDAHATAPSPDLSEAWHRRCVLPEGTVQIHHDGRTLRGRILAADPDEGLVIHVDDGGVRHVPAASASIERQQST